MPLEIPSPQPSFAVPPTAMPIAERLPAVDGLRALAALMVYVYHAWQFSDKPALSVGNGDVLALGELVNSLTTGVDLFMVLSGFCLFWPVAKRPSTAAGWSWWNFAKRRIERIVPPYYASIVFVIVLSFLVVIVYRAMGNDARWPVLPDAAQFLTHLLFIHTWFPGTWDGVQGVYWSLGLEMQFYAVFPLVIWGYRRAGIRVVWYMGCLSVVYRVIIAAWTRHSPWPVEFLWSITFLGKWMEFAAGMLAAWLVARARERGAHDGSRGTFLLALAVAAYGLAMVYSRRSPWFLPAHDLLLSISFGSALVATCATRTPANKFFAWKPLTALGLISYSLFLTHQPLAFYSGEFLAKLLHLHGAVQFLLMVTLVLAVSIGFAYLFFKAFEAPFLRGRTSSAARLPGSNRVSDALL